MKKLRDDEYKIIYSIADDEKDEFCIEMLKRKKIKGIMSPVFSDNNIEYSYSGNLRWSEFIEKKITDKEILTVLKNICDNYTEIKAYFLKNNMLITDSREVFVNPVTYEVYFCILPVYEDYNNHKIENFIKDILFDIETDDGELIYNLMRHLKNKSYSFEGFYSYIKEQIEKTESKQEEFKPEPLIPEEQEEFKPEPLIPEEQEEFKPEPLIPEEQEEFKPESLIPEDEPEKFISESLEENQVSKSESIDESWNVVSLDDMLKDSMENEDDDKKPEDDENNNSSDDLWGFMNNNDNLVESFRENTETADKVQEDEHHSENLALTNEISHNNDNNIMPSLSTDNLVLSDNLSGKKKAYLFRQVNNEKIEINREYFMLGKYQYASYTFYNDSVSRTHATIITENNEYFIVDNESKNGTFLNGKKIAPNTKIKLHNMDLITLANETLVFYNK
ncbi:MAG TPA: hypothetical protein DIW26_01940 [Ruminococcus sp.]|nr:hypothetical protein [Ruminococcus sp.]